ncbi:hypothetical protein BC832DRAFT_420031 [Gaertneriomyces semiglobifer]|nr:hypothetical protein BC832DRAFT_420031 [Gaertneriomyces semiglobifer]
MEGGSGECNTPAHIEDLQKLKARTLQERAKAYGLLSSGGKADLVQRLAEHLSCMKSMQPPSSIVAIDIGTSNLGFAHLALEKRKPQASTGIQHGIQVHNWAVVKLDLIQRNPPLSVLARECQHISRSHLPDADLYLVERQSYRCVKGVLAIPPSVLNCRLFEAMLTSLLLERTGRVPLEVLPRAVSDFWDLRSPTRVLGESGAATSHSYRHKKKQAVKVAEHLLQNGSGIRCPDQLKQTFLSANKKDDMADALLMGVAWYRWFEAAEADAVRWDAKAHMYSNLT